MPREMKDSGIEWIGEIPAEWICDKVCRQFALIGSGTTPKSDNDSNYIGNIHWIQSGDINGGILHNTKNKVSNEVVEKYSALKVYKSPFIVIAMYGASIGNISSSIIDGCVNQACCVLSEGHMNIKYAFYTLKSAKDYLIYNGVGGGQPNISQDIVKQLRLPVPSIREQEMIADYLDKKCSEIDAVIEKTKATIEEYKKLKQSVITEAVTKGIRGERPMKESGIEWIGDIPADWEIRKLFRAIDKIGDIDHYMPESTDTGIPYLMTGDLKEKLSQVDFDVCKQVSFEDYEILSSKIKATQGDVIFARYATIGTVCIVDIDKEFLVSYSCLTIKPTKSLLMGNFLFYYLKSSAFFEDVKQYINSNTQANVGLDSMTKAKIVLPVLQEQREIVNYLDQKCAEIDTLIAKKTALLEEMEAYKKSVIYEYVTGKKEVE